MLINTIHGPMDDTLLMRADGFIDNENESIEWVEYTLNGEIVHRSANITLKKSLEVLMEGNLHG